MYERKFHALLLYLLERPKYRPDILNSAIRNSQALSWAIRSQLTQFY